MESKTDVFLRIEKKYLLSEEKQNDFLDSMKDSLIPSQYASSTVQSLYFDTEDCRMIRESLSHPYYKEKIRLRSYGKASPNETVYLEVKKKLNGYGSKRRISMSYASAMLYLQSGISPSDDFLFREFRETFRRWGYPRPRFFVAYERKAYCFASDPHCRITFDRNIRYRTDMLSLSETNEGTAITDENTLLMEIKCDLGAMPLSLASTLSKHEIYPTSFSKVGTAYTHFLQNQNNQTNIGETFYA